MDFLSMAAGAWMAIASFLGFGNHEHKQAPEQNDAVTRTVEEAVSVPTDSTIEYEDEYVTIYTDAEYRYIESTGLPNHETGEFPNSGNPNTISEQNRTYRVTLTPEYTGAQTFALTPGVALNGIPMVPGTAEREGDWNIEGLQETYNLGMDGSNAHVQPTGMYHYHGVPEGYLGTLENQDGLVQVGWAADGFAMYHDHSGDYTSGWELKSVRDDGTTPDGTYLQDFEFTGAGNLDECNGIWMGDEYTYFLTDEFPYIPRCLNGTADSSFGGGGGGGQGGGQGAGAPNDGGVGNNDRPTGGEMLGGGEAPAEAIAACSGSSEGSSCSFTGGRDEAVSGTCSLVAESLACAPEGGLPSGGQQSGGQRGQGGQAGPPR